MAYRVGVWGKAGENTSSNYRELRNLVEALEEMGENGELQGHEIFLFADNSVSEAVVLKGSSTSLLLYELVVRLWKLEMRYLCRIHFIHVAGTRMIYQGTDGLSRGDLMEGVMKGETMLSHIPIALSAFERWEGLRIWVVSWVGEFGWKPEVLTPIGWYERGHDIDGS